MWPARETKLPAITLSPALSGNELKPAIGLGNGTRRPRQRGDSADRPRLWAPPPLAPKILAAARGNVPVELTRSNTVRGGAPWSTLTALTKLDICKGFLQRHSAANPANTRRGMITAGVLLRPREAEARQRMLSLDSYESDTETRPHWINLSPLKAPHRDDDAFVDGHLSDDGVYPDPTHEPYRSKQASSYSPEPEPSTSRDQA